VATGNPVDLAADVAAALDRMNVKRS